jgi:hypothetical protein
MPIYLIFEFVGDGVHVFDIVLTSSLPPHNTAIRSSYLELDPKAMGDNYELDEFKRMHLSRVYLPVELELVKLPGRKKQSIINYQVYTGFTEIITNCIAFIVPNITEDQLFGNLILTVDKRKVKPDIMEYLLKLIPEPVLEETKETKVPMMVK